MVIVVIAIVYAILTAVVNWGVTIWGLQVFFSGLKQVGTRGGSTAAEQRLKVRPLHPDGCGGLKFLGDMSMTFNLILFFTGLLIGGLVLQDIVVNHKPVILANILMGVAYIVLAPLLFFLPLRSAHNAMCEAKNERLHAINTLSVCHNRDYQALIQKAGSPAQTGDKAYWEELKKVREEVKSLHEEYELVAKAPVWPFDMRTVATFTGTVGVPVFLPFLLQWLLP